jgi:hypothetical protein
MQSEQINELVTALIKAQPEFKPIKKDSVNPFFKSRYATLESVLESTGEALRNNGLVVMQTTDGDFLITTLAHTSGQFISGKYPLSAVKTDPQGIGSAVTYARRYAYTAIIGAAPTDEDDDGNSHLPKQEPKKETKIEFNPLELMEKIPTDLADTFRNLNMQKKDVYDVIVRFGGDFKAIKDNIAILLEIKEKSKKDGKNE